MVWSVGPAKLGPPSGGLGADKQSGGIDCLHCRPKGGTVDTGKYVYDRATRYLNCWFLLGQHATNRDLWETFRDSLAARSASTSFKHVYGHVGLLGNERADRLANQGRLRHPGRLQFLRKRRERHGLAPAVLAA